jgi:hypothetical protein
MSDAISEITDRHIAEQLGSPAPISAFVYLDEQTVKKGKSGVMRDSHSSKPL